MRNDPTYLGTVEDVRGASISVALDNGTVSGLAFIKGQGYRIGQVGSFVRIPLGLIDLFGIVAQVGAGAVPERLAGIEPFGRRWLTVQLVGEGRRHSRFQRGLSQYPTVSDTVHLVTEDDLARIYGRPNEPQAIGIGRLASAESLPALVDINRLISRHSAVVGTTGAGKSTTVAGLLASLSNPALYQSARVVLIDIHGEYSSALRDLAKVYRVNPDVRRQERQLCVPYWAMTSDELLPMMFGTIGDAERGTLIEEITKLKRAALSVGRVPSQQELDTLTVDTPVPFSIHQLWFDQHCWVNATHKAQQAAQGLDTMEFETDAHGNKVQPGDPLRVIPPKFRSIVSSGPNRVYLSTYPLRIGRQLDGLAARLRDPRFDFLFRPGPWSPQLNGATTQDLDTLLGGWLGGPEPITILDLSGVPASILNNLIGVVLRLIYDALFWARRLSEGGRERPLLVVLEEAHTYLGKEAGGPAAQAVRRIAKEGRKYGIGMMLVSQRPSELDGTILSQCGTAIAMRLANPMDRQHVGAAVTEHLQGLLDMLPILRTGEAIIVGEAVHLPVRTLIDPPPADRRPDSADPTVFEADGPGGWNRSREPEKFADVVSVWRSQDPRSPRLKDLDRPELAGMEWVESPESSNIVRFRYDEPTQTLEIEFKKTGCYQYFDVPQPVFAAMCQAESKGTFFGAQIRGSYRYARC